MSLTRRHYVLLAEALYATQPQRTAAYQDKRVSNPAWSWQAWVQWDRDVETIARALESDNPRGFDKPRFIAACRENMDKEQTA